MTFSLKEKSQTPSKKRNKRRARVVDPGYQPSPKKMKTQHERKDNSAKKIKKVVGSPKWCLVWEKTC
jgi:hypothetical protein